jgi:hypothetical protein
MLFLLSLFLIDWDSVMRHISDDTNFLNYDESYLYRAINLLVRVDDGVQGISFSYNPAL